MTRVNLAEWLFLAGALAGALAENWTATIVCMLAAIYLKTPRQQ